tara:strand:- start:241 stop:642 length:402 start_codon:yes stop_codon:yes gene_type:complete
MYSLEEVYQQAEDDQVATSLNGKGYESVMIYGIKIIRDNYTGQVQILNTMIGGDYYSNITEKDYETFLEKGWRYGVYVLSLSNYRTKLDSIERKIQKELTGRKSKKQLGILKTKRKQVLSKYSQLNYKLNQVK